jgi:hypothetical protein
MKKSKIHMFSFCLLLAAMLGSEFGRADAIDNSIDAAIMRQHRADVASGRIAAYRAPSVSTVAKTVVPAPVLVAATKVAPAPAISRAPASAVVIKAPVVTVVKPAAPTNKLK